MKRTPEREAHLYALMAWNDKYDKQQATSLIDSEKYENLDSITYAETSINAAKKGIEELFDVKVDKHTDYSKCQLEPSRENYNKIMLIIEGIHDKWVTENAKKYNRGSEEKSDKNLFQHLPTAFIGIDEVCKDLMFLAPFLQEMGIETGTMQLTPYGAFVPNDAVVDTYNRYVEHYKKKNKIASESDLKRHIDSCINGEYEPLVANSEVAQARVDYMKNKKQVLLNSIKQKNAKVFEGLSDEPNHN